MRKEYNFSKMKGHKNPYAKKLKKQVTLRLGIDVIEYFKGLAQETGIPYQNLINGSRTKKKLDSRLRGNDRCCFRNRY